MLHLDEARRTAMGELQDILKSAPRATKAVLIDDLFGRLRVVLWSGGKGKTQALCDEIAKRLKRQAGPYWTGEIWVASGGGRIPPADRKVYARAWDEAEPVPGSSRLRSLDRHRNRGAWFTPCRALWDVPRSGRHPERPPIVVFYSFKGGVGRTTALASFAIQQARSGERVVAIDADLDAPGLGGLLASAEGVTAPWGVVDYLLERPQAEIDLRDYYHACRHQSVTGSGEILVFPAGRVDGEYLGKLSRIDLEPHARNRGPHPLELLLQQVRDELEPHWILIDARAGLADPAGMLLGGLAHLHALFGTFSDQSWAGLRLVIERLGGQRVSVGLPQADCVLVQAMVPENLEIATKTRQAFADRARDEFLEIYYAEDPESAGPEGDFWNVGDVESSDAPHVPIPLSYSSRLADFRSIDMVADHLAEAAEYRHLAARLAARFGDS